MKSVFQISIVFLALIQFSCKGQQTAVEADKTISAGYKNYVANQYEYEKREPILAEFKVEIQKVLKNPSFKDYYFPIFDQEGKVTRSENGNLTILSWDWRNIGTSHTYESMYRLLTGDGIVTGFLFQDQDGTDEAKSAIYYKIYQLPDTSYLIQGWGTHGAGNDFFVLRKLSLQNDHLADCVSCFDGNPYLFFEKSRADNLEVLYNEQTHTITYPEFSEVLRDGEEMGFSEPTGNFIALKFKDGNFIKIKK